MKKTKTPPVKPSGDLTPIAVSPMIVDLTEPKKTVALVARQTEAISSITSDAEQDEAVALLSRVKTAQKTMTAAKNSIIKPLNAARKAVFDLFRPLEEKADFVEARLKDAMSEYYDACERRRLAAEAKVQAALDAGRLKQATADRKLEALAPVAKTVAGTAGGKATFTVMRSVEIYNATEIPDEYWTIDEGMVRAAVLAGTHVPGARVVNSTGVSAS